MASTGRVCGSDQRTLSASSTARPSRWLCASLPGNRTAVCVIDGPGRFDIGRDATAGWVLDEPTISRRHAVVTVDESVLIEDARSRNGVSVDKRQLESGERHVLVPGEVVRLGEVAILLVDERADAGPERERSLPAGRSPSAPARDAGAHIVRDPVMIQLHALARSVAAGNISVLLTGETGSGKEVFAEIIHRHSPRARKPLLTLNCAALSETLLESELFGHEKGAFTGATQTKVGLLESAEGGTVFLDEIGEMPQSLQAKLLRVLEQRQVTRVGGLKAKPIDVRFVSATNRDLQAEVARGTFRRDLYYRINGATLSIPPLRERPSEIEPLARLFAERAGREVGRARTHEISAEVVARLMRHAWPGNIRELRNVVDRAVLLCRGEVISEDDLAILASEPTQPILDCRGVEACPPSEGAKSAESADLHRIVEALNRCGGNQTRAAKSLGIARQTLIRRIAEYGLPRPKRGQGVRATHSEDILGSSSPVRS
jgi:two-component system, NtrC family, response regulator AtoC